MNGNTLSNLDIYSKMEFIEMARNYKLVYDSKIGLPKNFTFGVEIEAIHPNFIDALKERKDVRFYAQPRAYLPLPYDKDLWVLSNDESLCSYGGEISSPILKDNWKSWRKLKKMLLYIEKKLPGVYVNDLCGGHIHFGAEAFGLDGEKLFAFMVLLAENEQVLTRFYNGEFVNLREGADMYAKSFADIFLKVGPFYFRHYLDLLEYFYDFAEPNVNYKEYSFDFSRLYLFQGNHSVSNTFEARIPNGSLSKEIIQNNIRITGRLLECAISGKYDYEKGLYNIHSWNRNNSDINLDDAFYVADFLPTDDDKMCFLKQYYKDGSETNDRILKKSLSFY